jgi:hypothetical protein
MTMRFYPIVASIGFAILLLLPAGCSRTHREDSREEQDTVIAPDLPDHPHVGSALKAGGGYQGPLKKKKRPS